MYPSLYVLPFLIHFRSKVSLCSSGKSGTCYIDHLCFLHIEIKGVCHCISLKSIQLKTCNTAGLWWLMPLVPVLEFKASLVWVSFRIARMTRISLVLNAPPPKKNPTNQTCNFSTLEAETLDCVRLSSLTKNKSSEGQRHRSRDRDTLSVKCQQQIFGNLLLIL